jgi:Fe(3+) dicitrate transport protein
MPRFTLQIMLLYLNPLLLLGQSKSPDSFRVKQLEPVLLKSLITSSEIAYLPRSSESILYVGKKNTVVNLEKVQASLISNNMRQVMARVPGIHVWESEGSGIQIGMATRGLSPNRSWEFNVRQNGYDISADPYGYPEAYYAPPLQAVKQLVVLRGHGALQFGPQFGGMVNYVLRNGSEIKSGTRFETYQTVGSNGLFGSYNALGGQNEKGYYHVFANHISGDGWRNNSRFRSCILSGNFTRKIGKHVQLTAEFTHNGQRMQQAGGLTDSAFGKNPRLSMRSRNWLDIGWTTAALMSSIRLNKRTTLDVKAFMLSGTRTSVGYLRAINIPDTINSATGMQNSRTIDKDRYSNLGIEARALHTYRIGKHEADFSGGVRIFSGRTERFRDGKGSTDVDYDPQTTDSIWPKAYSFQTFNVAAFAENSFRIGRLDIIPGIRLEYLGAAVEGRNGFAANGTPIPLLPEKRDRLIVLGGIGMEYKLSKTVLGFANITQAFRPMLFSDLTAPAGTDSIDPELKDASGFNADLGFRGRIGNWLTYDAGIYYLRYNNRIGAISRQHPDGSFFQYRTNVGNSGSAGAEILLEVNVWEALRIRSKKTELSGFISYALNRSTYGNLRITTKSGNSLVANDFSGNIVENAPLHVLRAGIRFQTGGSSFSLQTAFTGETYTDAANTVVAGPHAQNGLLPSYRVSDFHWQHTFCKNWQVKFALNNIFNARYATRRSGGYPGPGLLPADGRNASFTIGKTF